MGGFRQRRWGIVGACLVLVLMAGGLSPAHAQEADEEATPDDAAAFYEIVETAVTPSQLEEMSEGIGPLGILADGQGRASYDLPSGVTVPAAIGQQPVPMKPLAPLPMPDNPGLLDELASGGVHSDGYNSSTSPLPGPRGLNPLAITSAVHDEEIRACTPLLRDLEGHLASLCISLFTQSELVLFDPSDHFKILARTAIPERTHLLDPAGGWYTRMDHLGRPLVPTATQLLRAYKAVPQGEAYEWTVDREWDLSTALPEGMSATDVIPSFDGGFWFISGFAHVGHLDADTGEAETLWLHEDGYEVIGAAFAVGPEGAYVLTSKAMYMFSLDSEGVPTQRWRWLYGDLDNPDLSTPTLHDEGRLVNFSINHGDGRSELVVLDTSAESMSDDERVVCRMDMFESGTSAIQNTAMAYGRAIVVENNFGGAFYEVGDFPPGLARVDVREDYSGCDRVWQDDTLSSQVPPRLSTGDGHIWLYAHRRGEPEDVHAYYLSAVDFESGEVVSETFVASGKRMDNPMLSLEFLPGGVMVGGVRNGIISVCDAELNAQGEAVCVAPEAVATETSADEAEASETADQNCPSLGLGGVCDEPAPASAPAGCSQRSLGTSGWMTFMALFLLWAYGRRATKRLV